MSPTFIDIENLADYFLAFTNVIADILDPPGRNFRDRDEALTAAILVQRNKCYKILDILYGTDNQFRFLRPFSVKHGMNHLSSEIISALMFAFPPVGSARSCPQTTHFTT